MSVDPLPIGPLAARPDLATVERAAVAALGRPVELVEQLHGGARRDSYRVVDDEGDRFVMRFDRDAASLAKEVALTRLVGERVPVTDVVAEDLSGEQTGVPFTISTYADGVSLDDALASLDDEGSVALGAAAGRTLAAIGTYGFEIPGAVGSDLHAEPLGPPLPDMLVTMGSAVLSVPGTRELLGKPVADAYLGLLEEAAPTLEPVAEQAALVHSDFNGKNLVVSTDGPRPEITAVLDWEFSFAGPPLADVGNMLRLQERLPTPYIDGFVAGFDEGGGALPPGWRSIAAALDALALLDFLDRGGRGERGPMLAQACALVEEAAVRGDLAPPLPG